MAIVKSRIVSTSTRCYCFIRSILNQYAVIIVMMGSGLVFFNGGVRAQDRLEVGAFLGTSYYFGDLNPGKQFYKPHPAFGGLARYAFNERIALKATAIYGRISGEYPDKDLLYKETSTTGGNYSFVRNIGDLAAQCEINFRSYDHPYISTTNFTPYVSIGLATTFYNRIVTENGNDAAKPVFILSLPFGVGGKYKINKWVRVGAEWTFRKTFVDDLDYIGGGRGINPSDPYGFGENTVTHNNDWYSFAGVYVTISFLKRKARCNGGY